MIGSTERRDPAATRPGAPGSGGPAVPATVAPGASAAPLPQERARPSAPQRATGAGADLPQDFEAWFRDHRESVYKYVRFRLPSRDIAEDVTSDVFLKALRSLASYDPSRSAPRTWLLRIARNAVTDHVRSLKRSGARHVSLDRAPDLVSGAPSQEERMLLEEEVNTLLGAVATLRSSDQEILSLRYGAEMRNLEIAETLGLSPNAVAVRLHRALRRLRQRMPVRMAEQG